LRTERSIVFSVKCALKLMYLHIRQLRKTKSAKTLGKSRNRYDNLGFARLNGFESG